MWAFETGNQIALTSAVSGTCLEIMDGIVECHGEKKRETGKYAGLLFALQAVDTNVHTN